MKLWAISIVATLAVCCVPAWAQWQHREDFDLVEARVEAGGAILAVACEYDDWDDEIYEELRVFPPAPGSEEDEEPLKGRAPRLAVHVDGWEWVRDAHPFYDGVEKRLYFWAPMSDELSARLATASAPIRALVTLSAPAEAPVDQSFTAEGSMAAMEDYEVGCATLW